MSAAPITTLAGWERQKAEWAQKIRDTASRHKSEMEGVTAEYQEAVRQCNLAAASLDSSKILLAEHILSIQGKYSNAGTERQSALEDAVQDLLSGCARMRVEYFGTKSYAQWHGQRCDCEYGYGPRHGSIIFSIGLSRPLRGGNGRTLTEEEIDAAVYYLRNIEKIQAAEPRAAQA